MINSALKDPINRFKICPSPLGKRQDFNISQSQEQNRNSIGWHHSLRQKNPNEIVPWAKLQQSKQLILVREAMHQRYLSPHLIIG